MKTLHELLIAVSKNALSQQNSDGSMPAGHNGPWNDPETPVRNTGHWLISFAKAYEISGEPEFRDAGILAMQYLLSEKARPMGATFWHRLNPDRDFSNGVIGSAWTIEALVTAAKAFSSEECINLACEVFLRHPFDPNLGVWRVVNVDGSYSTVDMVFNHQLWFAASGALLANIHHSEEIKKRVTIFLDRLDQSFAVRKNGVIRHAMTYPTFLRRRYDKYLFLRQYRSNLAIRKKKELGYHAFNLHGFALLKTGNEQHSFWASQDFNSAVELIQTQTFKTELENSPYGYPYNPPGFEVPTAIINFASKSKSAQTSTLSWWLNNQLKKTFNSNTMKFDQNTPDAITLTARIYEATRLPDLPIDL